MTALPWVYIVPEVCYKSFDCTLENIRPSLPFVIHMPLLNCHEAGLHGTTDRDAANEDMD